MISLPKVTLTATLSSFVAPVIAGDWWIIGAQQSFCRLTNKDDTHYNWRGSDRDCHSFPTNETECLFAVADGEAFSTDNCEHGDSNFIQSLQFHSGKDNSGAGCIFFEDPECVGEKISVSNYDIVAECYEFDDFKVQSFQCS